MPAPSDVLKTFYERKKCRFEGRHISGSKREVRRGAVSWVRNHTTAGSHVTSSPLNPALLLVLTCRGGRAVDLTRREIKARDNRGQRGGMGVLAWLRDQDSVMILTAAGCPGWVY